MNDKPEWKPNKYRCLKCSEVIFSEWPGQWVSCKCGAIFVDQTRHYERRGGYPEDFERVKYEAIPAPE